MNALTTIRNRLLIHSAIVVASTVVLPIAAQPAFAQTETTAADVVSVTPFAPPATAPVVTDVVGGVQVDLNAKQSVIDWTHFNIVDSTRTINFTDTSGLGAGTVVSVLNRVVGNGVVPIETSVINGTLSVDAATPNVVVWISNPNGITFGASGIFSGGSLVLTTAAISNADFTSGDENFSLTGAPYYKLDLAGNEDNTAGLSAITLMAGSNIDATGDFGAAAQHITASGTIKATGEVALIAAQDIDLAINPGSPIGYTIKAGTTVGAAKLKADGTIDAKSIVLTGAGRRTVGTESDLLLEIGNTLTAATVGGKIFIGTETAVSNKIGGNNDAMKLVANTTLKGGTIEIASNLDSDGTPRSLTITGDAKLGGRLGSGAALGSELTSLSVSGATNFVAAGTTALPSVKTVTTQDYAGPVTLTADTVLTGTAVTFGGLVDGAKALEVNGNAVFKGTVGTTPLTTVLVTGTTDFQVAGTSGTPSVTTTGTQEYKGAATLTGDTVLKGSTVTMGGTVNGAQLLEVQGNAVFKDTIGDSAVLTSVKVTGKTDFQAAGTTAIPSVTTSGAQDYQGAATLTGNTVLKGTLVTFASTVDGGKALEIQGDTVFKDLLGDTNALASVLVTGKTDFQAAGTTANPSVTTTGTQEYQGDATLTDNTVLKGSTVTMGGEVNGAKAYEVQGDAVFTKALGNNTALTTVLVTGKTDFQYAGATGSPSVTTTGTQEYQGAATLTGNTVLKGTTVTMGGTVNGGKLLEVQGDAVFKNPIGNTTALTTVTVTGKTDFQAAGTSGTPSVTTTGAQDYQGAATLTGNTVLKGSTVTFGNTVNGGKALEIQGDAVLTNALGNTTALASVLVTGKTDFQYAGTTPTPSVTTTGTQEYQGAATLTADTVLKGSTATFGSTVNGAKLLEVQGNAVLKGIVGGTTALTTVTVTGKTDFQAAGTTATPSVTTTGAQDYQGAATVTGNTVLKGTTVTMGGTVNGAKLLEVQGDAVLKGIVGGTTALTSVTVTGKTDFQATGTSGAPSVTTTGTQEYQGVATLTADTVLKGSTVTFGTTVDGAKLLEVQGDAVLKGIVGGTTALTSVKVTGKTDFQTAGSLATPSVTTTGTQNYVGAATLTADTVLKGTSVAFGSTVDAAVAGDQLLQIVGSASFAGKVGDTKQLESIEVSGGTAITATANADLNAVKFIKLDATGPITTAGLTTTGVTGDILVNQNGGAGTVVIGGNVSATGNYYVSGSQITLGDSAARIQSAAGKVTISSGDILQGSGPLTLQSDRNGIGGNALTLSATDFNSSVNLFNTTLSAGTISGSVYGQQSNASVEAYSNAKIGSIYGLNSTVKATNGNATVVTANATDAVVVSALNGAALVTTSTAGDSIKVSGGSATLSSGNAGITIPGTPGTISVLAGTGDALLGTGNASGAILVQSTGAKATATDATSTGSTLSVIGVGDATLTKGSALLAVLVKSTGADANVVDATSTGSSITVDANQLATVSGAISAKTTYDVTGGTGVVLGDGSSRTQTASGAVTIKATTGNVTQGSGRLTLQSNNDGVGTEALSVTATTGSVTLANSQLVGGTISGSTYGLQSDVTVTADKNATLAELAGLNVKATATNGVATVLENVAAKAEYTVTGGTGVVLGDATSRTQSAGGKVTITATTGNVTQGSAPLTLISDNDGTGSDPLTVKALTGAVTLGNSLLSGGNITFTFSGAVYGNTSDVLVDAATSAQVTELHGLNATVNAAGGDATVVNAGAANAIAITASNNASLGTGKAGGTILVKGTAGTATLGDGTSTGSSITVNAGTLATVSGTISAKTAYTVTGGTGVVLGDATARTQAAGGAVTITATTGNVTQGSGLLTLQSDSDGTGSDPLTIKALTGNVTLGNALLAGGTISGSTYGKQSDVLVDAKQNATLIDLRGLNTTVAAQTGNATVTTADAAQAVSVTAPAGAASLGTGTAGTSILVSGVSGSLGNGTAGTTLSVLGTTGDASLTTGKAGGAVLVKSTGANANVVDATSTGSSITVDGNKLATISGTISAKTAYAVTGGTGVVLGDATARTQAAGGAVTITATTGNVTQGAGLLTLQSDNDGTGSDPLTIKALTGNVTLGNALLAGGTISGSTYGKQSDVLVDAKQNATLIDLRGLNTTVAAQTGNATVTTADAAQAVSVTAPAGAASLGTGTAGTSILVSGVSGSLGNGTAGTTLSVLGTTGDASLTTGKAGGAVLVKSTGANANVVDATSTGSSITVDAGTLATISGTISAKTAYTVTGGTGVVLGDATARTQAAGGAVTITATTGNVTQGAGLLTLQSDSDGTGSDPLTIKALTGNVTLGNALLAGGTISGSTYGKQSDVLVDAKQNAMLIDLRGLNTTVAAQTGNATVTTADAAQAVSVTAPAGAASLGTGTAGTSILVSGVSGSLGNGTAGTTLSVLGTTGDASLTTGKAGGAVLVKSTGANANVVDATSTGSSITVDGNKLATISGTISAKTAYTVTGGTGVVLGDATARTQAAGGAVTITATTGNVTQGAGLLTLQSDNDGSAGDPLTVKALTGSVTLGNSAIKAGTSRQSDVSIDAADNASLVLVDGRDIAIKTNRIALGGAVTGGNSVTLTNRSVRADGTTAAVNNTVIGAAGDEASLYVLTAAEIANVTAPNVRVVTEQPATGTKQNVTLDTFALKSAVTRYEFLTTPATTGTPVPKITLVGAITGSDFAGTLQIGGTSTSTGRSEFIEAQLETATIDLPKATLELRADKIVFGVDSLRNNATVTGGTTAQIASDIVSNAGSVLYNAEGKAKTINNSSYALNTFLRAKVMKVSYTNFALFQNTLPGQMGGVHLGVSDNAVDTTTLALDLDSKPVGSEDAFGMFGKINGFIGRTAGLLPESVIVFSDGTGTGRTVRITQSNSRINGCVIGSPDKGCLITDVQPPALKLFDERQAQIFTTGDEDTRIILDPLVATNNEALLGDLAVPTLNYEVPTCELKADKTCKETK